MIDLKNYRYPALIGGGLGLLLLAANFALLAATGPAPGWLVPARAPLTVKIIEANQARVDSLQKFYRLGGQKSTTPFFVFVGMSTAREGIDPVLLQTTWGVDMKPFGICGNGGSMTDMAAISAGFFQSGLKPTLAILCVHPAFLVGRPLEAPPESLNPTSSLRHHQWHEAIRIVSWWNWFSSNRVHFQYLAEGFYYRIRVICGAIPPTNKSPWEPLQRFDYPKHQDADRLNAQLSAFEGYGWFNRREYSIHQQAQAKVLIDTIARFQALGSRVVVVFMPERSEVQKRIPSEAKQYLVDLLKQHFAQAPPLILDFAAAVPDDGFSDYTHMNDLGRSEFTVLLAEALKKAVKFDN
ncbi:MAG: hypothetical protein K8T91_08890 [Planctomycetes bacterium]|nr:hypothetical protein [Planctomycetota bacterium]